MTPPEHTIWDASTLLAVLNKEEGAETAEPYIYHCIISAVNMSEVLAKMLAHGHDAEHVYYQLRAIGVEVIPFDADHALVAADLMAYTKPFGLSFADRACLSLGKQRRLRILTADRIWASLTIPNLAITVIR
jgi:ribonuclease VapC